MQIVLHVVSRTILISYSRDVDKQTRQIQRKQPLLLLCTLLSPPTYFPLLLGIYNALKYRPKSATFWEIISDSLEVVYISEDLENALLQHFPPFLDHC